MNLHNFSFQKSVASLTKILLVSTALVMHLIIHLPTFASEDVQYEDEVKVNNYGSSFSDLSVNSDIATAAEYLRQKGIIGGFSDGTFRPDQLVNRAEASKFFVLSAQYETVHELKDIPFRDIILSQWYAPYVLAAAEYGIINGYPDAKFRPQSEIIRVEFLAMLQRTFTNLSADTISSNFTDIETNAWYSPYTGLVDDYDLFSFDETPETLEPQKPMTRGEFALGLYNYLKSVNGDFEDLSSQPIYPDYSNFEPKTQQKSPKKYVQNWWNKVRGISNQEYKAFLKASKRYTSFENTEIGIPIELARFYVKNSPSTKLEIDMLKIRASRSLENIDLFVETNHNTARHHQAQTQLNINTGLAAKGELQPDNLYQFSFDETIEIHSNVQNTFIVYGLIQDKSAKEQTLALTLEGINHKAFIDDKVYENFTIIHQGKSLAMNPANLVQVTGLGSNISSVLEIDTAVESISVESINETDVKIYGNSFGDIDVIGGANDVSVGSLEINNTSPTDVMIQQMKFQFDGDFTPSNYQIAFFSSGIQQTRTYDLSQDELTVADINLIVPSKTKKDFTLVLDTVEIQANDQDIKIKLMEVGAEVVQTGKSFILQNDQISFDPIIIRSKPVVGFSTQSTHSGIAEIQPGQLLEAFNLLIYPQYDDIEIADINLRVTAPNESIAPYMDFVLVTTDGKENRASLNSNLEVEFELSNQDRVVAEKNKTTHVTIFVQARDNIPEGSTMPFDLVLEIPEYISSTNGVSYQTYWTLTDRPEFELIGSSIQVPFWTNWMDRDNPGGTGDWETIAEFRSEYWGKCDEVVTVECQTVNGQAADTTGQIIQCTNAGFSCQNEKQSNGQMCQDYKVRFQCLNN